MGRHKSPASPKLAARRSRQAPRSKSRKLDRERGAEIRTASRSKAGKRGAEAKPSLRACAAPPGSPEVIYDFNRLPDPIKETLRSIVVAAQSGNIDEMLSGARGERAAADAERQPPSSDPIAFWKKASADGKGHDILAAMLNVFSSGFVRKGEGKDAMYIWPYFAEMDLTKLTPAQEVDLYRIVPPPQGIEMKKSGKYTYYRAGIGADGRLALFSEIELRRADRGSASPKRTGSPAGLPSSPSHMAIPPRTMVPTGQPVTFCPAKGVQPHLLPIQSFSITRSALRSTMVRSAS